MRLILTAAPMLNNQMATNLTTVTTLAHKYQHQGIDFLCFGEAYLQGFDGLTWTAATDYERAITLTSQELQALQQLARTCELGLALGYYEKENTKIYSAYVVIDATGNILGNYRRISRGWKIATADNQIYRHHDSQVVSFDYRGKKVGLGLCGDFWVNPQLFAAEKADVYLWPVYTDYSVATWQESARGEYAAQAQLVGENVCLINSFCPEKGSLGGSTYFKAGKILQELPLGEVGELLVEV